ncbi:MAG: hypothetical protein LBD85_03690 [Oscillospiraceae bacterium]|jgi:hypothetical protein|nr:hypothetical protein [Oscillospiraceae bacterium]
MLSRSEAETAISALLPDPGYEYRSDQLILSGLNSKISAATVYDSKLWCVSDGILYSADTDGSNAIKVTDSIVEDKHITFDSTGNVYFGFLQIVSYSKGEKTPVANQKQNQYIQDIFTLDNGTAATLTFEEDTFVIRELNDNSVSNNISFRFPDSVKDINGIYYYNGVALISDITGVYPYSDIDAHYIFKWSDLGVVGINADLVGIDDNLNIIFLDHADGKLYFTQITPTISKTEISLAVVAPDGWVKPELETAVIEFNRSQKEYKVNMVKYSSPEKLNLEIISGHIPDLLEHYGIPFASFVNKGLFEDLNPFIDANPELTMVSAFRRTLSSSNALYRISPGIYIYTLIGSTDYVGTEMGWTINEMKEIFATMPKGATIINAEWGKELATQYFLKQNIDKFVNWETGTALFDLPDFKWTLEFINSFPDKGGWDFEIPLVLEGKQMMIESRLFNFGGFAALDRNFESKWVIKGYPSEREAFGLAYAEPYTLSMTVACTNKDAAWSFIRYTLLSDIGDSAYPVVQSKFDEAAEKAMTTRQAPPFDKIPLLNQEQFKKFLSFIERIEMVSDTYQELSDIIAEESAPYFAGQKTLDEVCEIIQSRAKNYIAEQR